MNRLVIPFTLALVFSAAAPAQDAYQTSSDPGATTQDVDTSSPVDRQAEDTYQKNSQPPVPAAPLAPDRPADMRPKDISGSADQQAAETYRANALPPVPTAHYGRTSVPSHRHSHRRRHHRHAAGYRPIADHRADHTLVEPTSTPDTIPPGK